MKTRKSGSGTVVPAPKQSQIPGRLRAGAVLSLLMGIAPAGLAAAVPPSGSTGVTNEWTTNGGTLEGTRYSELDQINNTNIDVLHQKGPGLTLDRIVQTGVNGSHMGSPLVIGSTLYVVTPFPNKLVAYNLADGTTKWTFTPQINGYAFGVNCCDTVNRGPSYGVTSTGQGLIVYNTLDDATVAVDAATGVQKWRTILADPKTGVTTNGATLIVPNKAEAGKSLVIMGSSSGEMAVRGWVKALDLDTGTLKWTAYTTGPDADVKMAPEFYSSFYMKDKALADKTDLGVSSWEGSGDKWKQGGSSVWGYITYDPETDLLFHGTSQPGVWNADQRPGDNKWGASVFARKASTGEAVWIYQTAPHDYWDYDSISESVPLTLTTPINGHDKVLIHFNKNGFAYTFDRLTGEILSAPKFGPAPEAVNWADHIDLATGLPALNLDPTTQQPIKATHQGVVTQNICPSAMGLKGWEPSAYSPKTGLFYLPTFNLCMNYQGLKAEYIAGAPYMGQNISMGLFDMANRPFMGEMVAWDISTGTRKWAQSEPSAIYTGILATKGDVIFYGTLDNKFKARDANTGDLLYETRLNDAANGYECSAVGNPISFSVDVADPANPGQTRKEQRIAIFSGVGWLAGGFTATGKPCPGKTGSETTTATNGGGRVHIFKLGN